MNIHNCNVQVRTVVCPLDQEEDNVKKEKETVLEIQIVRVFWSVVIITVSLSLNFQVRKMRFFKICSPYFHLSQEDCGPQKMTVVDRDAAPIILVTMERDNVRQMKIVIDPDTIFAKMTVWIRITFL